MIFRSPEMAFMNAIDTSGKLPYMSETRRRASRVGYVGDYMYMDSTDDFDRFKHIQTRMYVSIPREDMVPVSVWLCDSLGCDNIKTAGAHHCQKHKEGGVRS